ncbi:MAG: 1-pyrroline-5-carboxylate dehydrogenase [Deltaproteobacteria bacterium HGW-Deltaproteobacteria-14]|nr:MAG: 1-pyrroline-5-carboxylate dehydrogenase [Deltaproteobacteria bacterium HGW-Deltaproteobacteria-14]
MSTMSPKDMKITYTSSQADLSAFHRFFDEALDALEGELDREYPLYIGGEAITVDAPKLADTSPIDGRVLGRFQLATKGHVDQAVAAANAAKKGWAGTPWSERVTLLRRAADLIRERKFHIAALMAWEVGKNRLEAMGDVEESADLIDYYCDSMDAHSGYIQEMKALTPIEHNLDVLRPYGVFACIAPFNFPAALLTGMSAAALVAGNTLVMKPAQDTPWTGLEIYKAYVDAGVPGGAVNFVTGKGSVIGDHLTLHPGVDGVVFTGSKEVGMRIFHQMSTRWIKPCLLELGGKNPTIVMPSADVEAAAEGAMRSAWGLQNQKCSATSRVYVHKDVAAEFTRLLIEKTKAIAIGNPVREGVYFGPVINAAAVKKYDAAVAGARELGTVLYGGGRLTEGDLAKGNYVSPCIAKVPHDSWVMQEEHFVPFLGIVEVDSLDEALTLANDVEYGLTAGFFSGEEAEIARFFDEIEAGTVYVNKRTGATTGAWPGSQPFTGWKGSGGSGKGGCGPYYVAQFMREQSRTRIVR